MLFLLGLCFFCCCCCFLRECVVRELKKSRLLCMYSSQRTRNKTWQQIIPEQICNVLYGKVLLVMIVPAWWYTGTNVGDNTRLFDLSCSGPNWFTSYLKERSQRVSSSQSVLSLLFGVPQGSFLLSCITHNVYINGTALWSKVSLVCWWRTDPGNKADVSSLLKNIVHRIGDIQLWTNNNFS